MPLSQFTIQNMAPRGSEIKQSKWLVNATITVLLQNMAPRGSEETKQSKWLVKATITVHNSE